jgi:hypothetical protein
LSSEDAAGSPEETPTVDGPDPRQWEHSADLHKAAEDVRAADAMLDLLQGTRPRPPMTRLYTEALALLESTAVQAREVLAARLLEAHGITLPEEADTTPEAVGGFHGDGDSTGDRDHL